MTTKAEFSAGILTVVETLMTAAAILTDDPMDDLDGLGLGGDFGGDELDQYDLDQDDTAEMLELTAINWLHVCSVVIGDGQRGSYTNIPKSADFFTVALRSPDRWFRQMFRLGRDTFDALVKTLSKDSIFESKGRKPQRHIKYQLGAYLVRYGSRGCDSLETARKLSIGHGTVHLYCRRVTTAIRRMRKKHVMFPNEARQEEIARCIEEKSGFPGCTGGADGSLVIWSEAPSEDGVAYFSRKKTYSSNTQITVDHEYRITSYELGWPGSVPDVTVFKQSYIWKQRHNLFKDGYYLFADKGYPSSPWVVRPFDETEISKASPDLKARMRAFNKQLSSVRIVVEHVFGMLKGRFPSLKLFGSHNSIEESYEAIESLFILHNICIDLKDAPEDIFGFDAGDDPQIEAGEENMDADEEPLDMPPANIPARETDSYIRRAGQAKRNALLDMLFPA